MKRWNAAALAVFLIGVAIFIARLVFGCYHGDPGYGNVDYPPERRDAGSG